eukprot:4538171-Pleurochrysis_carterae.AAC.1
MACNRCESHVHAPGAVALLEGHPQIFLELLRRVGLRAALHIFSAPTNLFAGRACRQSSFAVNRKSATTVEIRNSPAREHFCWFLGGLGDRSVEPGSLVASQ